ncbi:hypothetical protein GCM10010446_69440 [Streptomyces enissocaesilis]|uniref:Transposase IS30-like HTH domain-containing protein n=1 Tax=Streptomyces enissocaesilis TaxID=332589 RepID=A0ABP6K9F7_9ACTN
MVRRQQAADRAVRPKLRSPGRPKYQRHVEAAFWTEIAKGLLAEEAAVVVGVAPAVATRWFRQRGGMRPFGSKPSSGRYLSFSEREEIALLKARGKGVREIVRDVGRNPGTISRELRRNAATRSGKLGYRASVAQWRAGMAARRPKTAKLVAKPRLHAYVQERLSGQITPEVSTEPGTVQTVWREASGDHFVQLRAGVIDNIVCNTCGATCDWSGCPTS